MTPEEAVDTVQELLAALEKTMILGRVREGMILLNAVGIVRQEMVPDPKLDHMMEQMKAAFNEAFGLSDVEWEIFHTEIEMDAIESFIELHPELKDEVLGDDDA